MAQYAAQMGKPIVSYYTPGHTPVEDLVCQRKRVVLSDDSFDGMVNKVCELAEDVAYRESLGAEIRDCVITSDVFNQLFAQCLESGVNPMPYQEQEPFKEIKWDIQDKLTFENTNKGYQRSVAKGLGVSSLWLCPTFIINSWAAIIKSNRVWTVIRNRI